MDNFIVKELNFVSMKDMRYGFMIEDKLTGKYNAAFGNDRNLTIEFGKNTLLEQRR